MKKTLISLCLLFVMITVFGLTSCMGGDLSESPTVESTSTPGTTSEPSDESLGEPETESESEPKTESESEPETESESESAISLSRYFGARIGVLPDCVVGYLACKSKTEVARYLYRYEENYVCGNGPRPMKFCWTGETEGEYTLLLSTDREFGDVVYEKTTNKSRLDVYNLIPGKYWWKVVSGDEESATDSFVVGGPVRTINCGNIINMRDEGGYEGKFGKIKYGICYRSTDISKADAAAKDVLRQLGIKTQIDLRLDCAAASPYPEITLQTAGIMQWDYCFPGLNSNRPFSQTYADNLKKAFTLFTDKSNYPIDFHCTYGADRTGTFAFLLGGILGMSYDDIVTDLEISSFYDHRRWRSDIVHVGTEYRFTDSGVMEDDPNNLVSFGKVYEHVMATYGTPGGKISDAVENYLLDVVGVTHEQIERIREIMIENYD